MPIQIISAAELEKRKRQQPQIDTQEPTLAPSVSQPVPATPQQTPVATAPQEEPGTLGEQFQAGVEEMKGWGAQFIGMAPAASKETSRTMAAYQQAKQEKASKVKMAVQDFGEVIESPSKIFQYGAERFARSAPGMVPYAVPVVGPALGAGTSFATTAGRIYGEQEEKDAERALAGAAGSAALETLGMGKLLSRPGAGVARDITTGVVTEGATEGGQQIIENIAAGKDNVFEGVGEAIAAGGTIGGGMRTVANIPQMPKAAKETAQSIANIRKKIGGVDLQSNPKVNYEIGRAVDMSGELQDINDALAIEQDEATRQELIRRRKEINNKAGAASFYKALDDMDKAGITLSPEALDMEIHEGLSRNSRTIGMGVDLAGFKQKDIKKARRARGMAKAGVQSKLEFLPGQTSEQTIANNRKKGRDYLADLSGQFNERVNKLTNMITDMDYAQRHAASPEQRQFLQDNLFKLRTARKQAEDLAKEMKAETRDRSRIYDAITNQANDLDEFLVSNNIDIGFNPIQLAQKYIIADRALVNQDPSFHEGISDEAKDVQDLAMRGATTWLTGGLPEMVGLAGRIKDRKLRKQMQKAIEETRRMASEDVREARQFAPEPEPEAPTPAPVSPAPTATEGAPTDAATQSIVAQAQAIAPDTQPVVTEDVATTVTEEAPVSQPEPDLGMIPRTPEPVVEEAPVEAPRVAGEDTRGMIPVIEQVKNSMVEVVQSATDGNPKAKSAADEVLREDLAGAITRDEVMDVVDDALGAAEEAAIKDGDTEVVGEIREVRDQVDMLPIPQMVQEAAPEVTEQVDTEVEQATEAPKQPDLTMVPGLVKEIKAEYEADPTVDDEKVSVDEIVEAVIMREPDLGMIPKIKQSVKEEISRQEEEVKAAEKEAKATADKKEKALSETKALVTTKTFKQKKDDIKKLVEDATGRSDEIADAADSVLEAKLERSNDVADTIEVAKEALNDAKDVAEAANDDLSVKQIEKTLDMLPVPDMFKGVTDDKPAAKPEEVVAEVKAEEKAPTPKAEPDMDMIPKIKEAVKEVKEEIEARPVEEQEEVTTQEVVEEVIARNPDLSMIPKVKEQIKEVVEEKAPEKKVEKKVEEKPKTSQELVYNQIQEIEKAVEAEQQIEEVLETVSDQVEDTKVESKDDIEGVDEDKTSAVDMVPPVKESVQAKVEEEITEDFSDAVEDVIENRNPDLGMIPKQAVEAIDKAQENVEKAQEEAAAPVRLGNIEEVKAMQEKQKALTIAKRKQLATNTLVEKGGDVDADDFNNYVDSIDESTKEADIKRKVGRLAKRHIKEADELAQKKLEEMSKGAEQSGEVSKNLAETQWERLDSIAEEYGVDKATLKTIKDRFPETNILTAAQQASIVKELNTHADKARAVQKVEQQWEDFATAAKALNVPESFVKELKDAATSPTKGLKELSKADRNALQKEAEKIRKEEDQMWEAETAKAEGYDWDIVKKMSETYDIPMSEVTSKLQKFVDTEGKPRSLNAAEFKSLMTSFEKYETPKAKEEVSKQDVEARWSELDSLAAQKGVSEEFVKNLKRKATKAGKGLQDVPSSAWDAVMKEGKRIEKEEKAEQAKANAEFKAAEESFTYKFAKDVGDKMKISKETLKDIMGRYVDNTGKPRDLSKKEFDAFYGKLEAAKKAQDAQAIKDSIAEEKAKADKEAKAEAALLERQAEAAERDMQAAKVVKKTAQWSRLAKIVSELKLPKKTLDSLKASHRNPETGKLDVIADSKYKSTVERLYKDYQESLEKRRKAVEAKRDERLAKAQKEAEAAVQAEQVKVNQQAAKDLEEMKAQRAEDLTKLKAKMANKLESRKQQNKLRIEASKRRAQLAKEEAEKVAKLEAAAQAKEIEELKNRREELKSEHKENMTKLKAKIEERKQVQKEKQEVAAKKLAEEAEARRKADAEQQVADLYVAQVQFLKNTGESLGVENIDDIIDTAFGRIAKPLTDNKLRSLYAGLKGSKKPSQTQDKMFNKLAESTEFMKDAIKASDDKIKSLESKVSSLEKSLKELPKVDVEAIAKEVSDTTASQMLDKFEGALAQGQMDLIQKFNDLAKKLMSQGKATEKAANVEEASRVVINVKRRMDRRRESGYDQPVEGMKGANGLFTREDVKQIQAVMGQGAFTTYMGPMGANFRGDAFGVVRPAAEQPMFNTLEDYKKAVKGQQTQAEPTIGVLAPAPQAKPQAKPEVTTYADVEKEIVQPIVEKQEKVEQAKAAETAKAAEAAKTESKKVDSDVDALAAKIAEAQKALKVEKPKATKPAKAVKPKTDIEAELGYKAESLKSAEHAKRSPTVQKLLDKYKGDAKTITPIFREVGKTVLASDEALSKKANTLKDSEKPVFQIQQGAKALGIKGAKDLPSKESLTEAYDKFMSKKTEEVKEEQQQALIERSEAALEKLTEAGVDAKKAEAPATKKPKSAPKQVGMTQRARTLLKEEINDRKDDLNSVETDLYDKNGEVKKDLPKGKVTELKSKAKDLNSQINKLEKKLEDDDSKKEGARKRAEAAEEKADKAKPKKLTKAALAEVDLSKGDENDIIAQAEKVEARLAKIAQAAKKVPAKTDKAKKAAVLERRIAKAEEDGDSEENLVVVDENNKIVGMVKDEDKALSISKKTPKSKVMTLAAALAIGASVSGAASAAEGESVEDMVDRYKVAGILTQGQANSFKKIGEDMLEKTNKSLDEVVDDIEGLFKMFDPEKNKDVPKRKSKKQRSDLSEKLGMRESSNNYKAENRLGYIGKYQFGWMALQDLGMVKPKPKGVSRKKWLNNPKAWTGRYNINSKKEFLNTPQVQEKVFKKWEEILNRRTASRGLVKFVGKTIDGVKVTRDGINAAAHLLGHGTVQKALRSGKLDATDANNVSIKEYMELMD